MKTTREMIEVMQAYEDEADIEFQDQDGRWYLEEPEWDWSTFDYRIKPIEKKKVKLYKYAYMLNKTCWQETECYYKDNQDFVQNLGNYKCQQLDYTMIEVDE